LDPEPSFSFFTALDSNVFFGMILLVVFLFVLVMITTAKVAFFSLTKKELEDLSQSNIPVAPTVIKLVNQPKKLLATLLIANNFTTLSVILLFFHYCPIFFSAIDSKTIQWLVQVACVALLLLLFGEVAPKVTFHKNKVQCVLFLAYPIAVLDKLFTPLSIPLRDFSEFVSHKLGKQKTNFSVDQLSQALELTSSEATSDEEQKILQGIVTFGNTEVKQVMSPRVDVFALDIEATFAAIYPKIVEKGYSRIPVYQDNIDVIKGVLFVKDLIPYINEVHFNWQELIREPFFVPENKKLDNLLKDFQGMKSHLAIVVDEYGGTSGIISLEDIIEEIVGEISDEFDEDNINFSKINANNYLFEGKINLKDFYRILHVDESIYETQKGEAETLAGFILELVGNFPKKGQKIRFENCIFTIQSIDKRRIKQIKVTIDA
jgi:gliding motility-associated protein GldE